jgi:hypothetical protein
LTIKRDIPQVNLTQKKTLRYKKTLAKKTRTDKTPVPRKNCLVNRIQFQFFKKSEKEQAIVIIRLKKMIIRLENLNQLKLATFRDDYDQYL